jgi:FixJ family two-component response regulator/chemotaxis methyl-accepting protein methylase/signal transduction histidine kinase
MSLTTTSKAGVDFPVVGIGASAGGLEACQHLLDAIPDKTGMAFILIQHLDPDHASMMAELLSGRTRMAVAQAVEGVRVAPDHLYLIPPGKLMSLEGGALHLEPARAGQALRLPFDYLLRSMATELGPRAVAVVLTGTGADGSASLAAIRSGGGTVLVQDPEEAAFDGMPRAALATGQVTRSETLAGLARVLVDHAKAASHPSSVAATPSALDEIIDLLRRETKHDFSLYKTGTLQRRIAQRIGFLQLPQGDLGEYLRVLQTDSAERERLAQDLLINVTEFFRDPEVFRLLGADIIPAMIREHIGRQPVRVWVAACSTGQEVYSLAMLFCEVIEEAQSTCKVEFFASDVDASALAEAREGFYRDTSGVGPERLARHFLRDGAGFRIKPELRAKITFARHDVLSDPPFARLNLLSCRNLMIYLAPEAQHRLLGLCHFALVEGGLLLLGKAETTDTHDRRFQMVSESARLYRNQARARLAAGAASDLSSPSRSTATMIADEDHRRPQKADPQPTMPHLADAPSPKPESDAATLRSDLAEALRELERTRAAQRSLREESLSVSEEYQAANEELLASKEELQSLNEELTALNSQLHETLEKQRATADDLQNVLYSTNVATLFLDTDLHIRFFTPAVLALFNMRSGDIGRPLADLAPLSSDRELLDDARAVLGGRPSVEHEIEARAGTWFSRRVFPYLTSGGKVAGVVITFSNITARRKISEALSAAERKAHLASEAKTRFLAVASHDLRQPLQTMVILQGLLATTVTGQRANDLVGRLGETLAAMARMLDVLLDMNQIEAGAIRPEKVQFRIDEIFERLRAEFSYSARAKGLQLRIVSSSLKVYSDPSLLEQILRNLLSNALKYTTKGKIVIGSRRRGSGVSVEVWDTGIGIAESEIEAVFDEYHQVNNPVRERSLGMGLGLSIVKRLGALLSHRIGAISRLGYGSVFTVEIAGEASERGRPFVKPPAAHLKRTSIASDRARILIVEDDPEVRSLLDIVVRDWGHETILAEDGPSALALVGSAALRPDLLLTDYNLPGGLNGLALASELRRTVKGPLPAIVLTGDISTLAMRHISQQDVLHLAKPVTVDRLKRALTDLLGPAVAPPAPAVEPPKTGTGTVFLVDDDNALRVSLGDLLRAAGHNVQDYPTSEAFLADYRPGTEGCLLIDAYLPGMSGLELLEQLEVRGEPVISIMITGHSDVSIAVAAMRVGAVDFVVKPVGAPELLDRIDSALARAKTPDNLSEERQSRQARLATLTPRQKQVLEAVLAGHASKIIASDLDISQRTVESHRAAIMEKLGAKSVPALVRAVLGAG